MRTEKRIDQTCIRWGSSLIEPSLRRAQPLAAMLWMATKIPLEALRETTGTTTRADRARAGLHPHPKTCWVVDSPTVNGSSGACVVVGKCHSGWRPPAALSSSRRRRTRRERATGRAAGSEATGARRGLGDTRAASKCQGKQPLAPVARGGVAASSPRHRRRPGRASARLAGALPRDCDHPTLAGRGPAAHHPIRRALGGCVS